MNFYKHHLGDYAKDTADLDALEHGIYRQLLDFYYATEKPLPNDWRVLRRVSNADRPAWQAALRRVVERFFPLGEDGLRHNKRVEKELVAYAVMRQCSMENINKRWSKEKANKINDSVIRTVYGNDTGRDTIQNPESRIQNPEEDKKRTKNKNKDIPAAKAARDSLNGSRVQFDQFWKAYPRKVCKPKAEKAFAKIHPDDPLLQTMLAAIEQQRKTQEWTKESGQFIPHPATWLNDRRWDDEILPKAVGSHAGFESTDYHAGVTSDGRF